MMNLTRMSNLVEIGQWIITGFDAVQISVGDRGMRHENTTEEKGISFLYGRSPVVIGGAAHIMKHGRFLQSAHRLASEEDIPDL